MQNGLLNLALVLENRYPGICISKPHFGHKFLLVKRSKQSETKYSTVALFRPLDINTSLVLDT